MPTVPPKTQYQNKIIELKQNLINSKILEINENILENYKNNFKRITKKKADMIDITKIKKELSEKYVTEGLKERKAKLLEAQKGKQLEKEEMETLDNIIRIEEQLDEEGNSMKLTQFKNNIQLSDNLNTNNLYSEEKLKISEIFSKNTKLIIKNNITNKIDQSTAVTTDYYISKVNQVIIKDLIENNIKKI